MSIVSLWKPDSFKSAEISSSLPVALQALFSCIINKIIFTFALTASKSTNICYSIHPNKTSFLTSITPCLIMPENLRTISLQFTDCSKVACVCSCEWRSIEWINNLRFSLVLKSEFSYLLI